MTLSAKLKLANKIVFGLCMLAVSVFSCAAQFFEADNNHFQYTGRIDFTQAKQPLISFAGTSIKAKFTGNKLNIRLDDQRGENFFNVIINGNDQFPYVIQAKQGLHTYPVAHHLKDGIHTVEIYKRTEGHEGYSRFLGLELSDNAKLLPAPARPNRRIAFFGDSITSGMGNEAADNAGDKQLSEKNNYLSYASITARNLNAEHHTISLSGIGIMASWFDFTMPEYYDQVNGAGNNDSKWDFKQWTPDIVVINLFQNDSWLVHDPKRISPIPNDENIIQAYIKFVNTIRSKYPNKPVICALGSMDITKSNSKWPGLVKTAVKRIKQQDNTADINTLFFEFTGYKAHPRVHQHQRNADKLTKFIKQKLAW
ncbi:electron transporter RnfD [Saccharobesus litoralis]|uniref:Electron transporter RnfD n=1 Tax=Saccharobesus litoralis TaxID=2172099 RepID=A0A2S0VPG7_9ALTE|nr:SGNH/GDSL hydrolase family protein [Saccharobesus litoralis]AWB65980.1 electron transporter RnfD [Saccharobesus litoralis]